MAWVDMFSFRFRMLASVLVVSVLTMGIVVTHTEPGYAEDQAQPVVGSFSVGGGINAGINERTGTFSTTVSVGRLAGMPVSTKETDEGVEVNSFGGFDVGVSYDSDNAEGNDRYGLGRGWMWNLTHIDTNGGVRVFSASGGVFEADASWPSGLAGYVLGDLIFRQDSGALPLHPGSDESVLYAYSLEYAGGKKDYFNSSGDLIARVGMYGEKVDLVWSSEHRLLSVLNEATRSQLDVIWTETGVEVVSSGHSDSSVSTTVFHIADTELTSITNPVSEQIQFEYEENGLLHTICADTGALTEISYQQLANKSTAVQQLRIIDKATNTVLSTREWKAVDEHLSSGWPAYSSEGILWGSGDSAYRYRTLLSDGSTDVVSEYNSLGLLISRELIVSTSDGNKTVQTQMFTFMGTEQGGVPPQGMLPKQYAKPTETTVVFRDSTGHTRQISEHNEYNETGQVLAHVDAQGTITETVYDTCVPPGAVLPAGLVHENTTTGTDGSVSKTVNTLTPDCKAVAVTETFAGTSSSALTLTAREEMTVDGGGFVSQTHRIATGSTSGGPDHIITRFSRTSDEGKKTATLSRTDAAGTNAEFTASVVVDLSMGQTIARIDPLGRVETTRYDAAGRVVEHTNYAGLQTVTEYGTNVTRTTNPQGVTTSKYIDAVGRVVKITTISEQNASLKPGSMKKTHQKLFRQMLKG